MTCVLAVMLVLGISYVCADDFSESSVRYCVYFCVCVSEVQFSIACCW